MQILTFPQAHFVSQDARQSVLMQLYQKTKTGKLVWFQGCIDSSLLLVNDYLQCAIADDDKKTRQLLTR